MNSISSKIADVIELLIESSNRINQNKPEKYWYPLSMATYGVEEIVEAIDSMCSFKTTMWEKTKIFEEEFSKYQECKETVMVNSGSSADLLLCFLLKDIIKDGRNEILVPAVTWPTQIWSLMMAGFKPILVDVDPKTLNIDYNDLEMKINNNTCAIFVVHVMGNPCDMNKISNIASKYKLYIMEDCCEALGAKFNKTNVGNFGIGGTYSFFFSHHMTTMEGGAIVCQDTSISNQLKVLRSHGWARNLQDSITYDNIDPRYTFVNWGFNVRPTELQAGFGLHQLNKLPFFNEKRRIFSDMFFKFIDTTSWLRHPLVDANSEPSWLGLPIIIEEEAPFEKSELLSYLENSGIETRPILTGNISAHPVASKFGMCNNFPGADIIHKQGFYIGLSPMQTYENMNKLVEYFQEFLKRFSI